MAADVRRLARLWALHARMDLLWIARGPGTALAWYVSDAVDLAPHLQRKASALLVQHGNLRAALEQLATRARAARSDRDADAFRTAVREWLAAMSQHEREENRLIQSAYSEDLGGRG